MGTLAVGRPPREHDWRLRRSRCRQPHREHHPEPGGGSALAATGPIQAVQPATAPLAGSRTLGTRTFGSGDDVVFAEDAGVYTMTNDGDGNFAIWSYSASDTDLVVNEDRSVHRTAPAARPLPWSRSPQSAHGPSFRSGTEQRRRGSLSAAPGSLVHSRETRPGDFGPRVITAPDLRCRPRAPDKLRDRRVRAPTPASGTERVH